MQEKRAPLYCVYTDAGLLTFERPGKRAAAILLQWVTREIAMATGGEQTTICELTRLRTIETQPFSPGLATRALHHCVRFYVPVLRPTPDIPVSLNQRRGKTKEYLLDNSTSTQRNFFTVVRF